MARWLVLNPHYLNSPGTTYRHEETNRDTGRRAIKEFPVPLYIDPADPFFLNRDGECIVAHEASAKRGDTIFVGDPTPDMEPIDDEAIAITDALRIKWDNPIESLPANGGLSSDAFMQELAAIMKGFQPSSTIPAGTVSKDEFEAMKARLAEAESKLAAGASAVEAAPPPAKPGAAEGRRGL